MVLKYTKHCTLKWRNKRRYFFLY